LFTFVIITKKEEDKKIDEEWKKVTVEGWK